MKRFINSATNPASEPSEESGRGSPLPRPCSLSRVLRAKGSNGNQQLHLTYSDGETYFTLTGEYRGAPIQIDFDESSIVELKDLRNMIDLIIGEANADGDARRETHPNQLGG
jgi:hypothetical protein